MAIQEELEKVLDKIDEVLSKALGSVEGYEGDDEPDYMAAAIDRLADTLHMRLTDVPKEAEFVRLSRFNVALLANVLSKWARDLESIGSEYRELAESTKKAWEAIDESQKSFEESKAKVLELLEKHAPELDIKSELQDAERS